MSQWKNISKWNFWVSKWRCGLPAKRLVRFLHSVKYFNCDSVVNFFIRTFTWGLGGYPWVSLEVSFRHISPCCVRVKIIQNIYLFFWSIVDLQWSVSFWFTAKQFSYAYTYIHFFSRLFSHIAYYRILSRVPRAIK